MNCDYCPKSDVCKWAYDKEICHFKDNEKIKIDDEIDVDDIFEDLEK